MGTYPRVIPINCTDIMHMDNIFVHFKFYIT